MASIPTEEPPTASMDEKALEIANKIAHDQPDAAVKWIRAVMEEFILAGYPGGDRTVQLANIRAAIKDAARYRFLASIAVDMGRCYEIPLEPGATLEETIDAVFDAT